MRQGEYIRTWHQWECSYCGAKVMVDNGDESDLTALDIEDAECTGCLKTFGVNPDYEGE